MRCSQSNGMKYCPNVPITVNESHMTQQEPSQSPVSLITKLRLHPAHNLLQNQANTTQVMHCLYFPTLKLKLFAHLQ